MTRLAAVVAVAVTALALASAASAVTGDSYCSPSGDYCTSAARIKGAVVLQVRTFSFRGRVRICVTNPRRSRTCRLVLLRRQRAGIYQVKVLWHRNFPRSGPGVYRVRFFKGTTRLGPALTFRLR
jgi:hypothetical protein